jgi:pyrimidine-nucleoside phosphorylase
MVALLSDMNQPLGVAVGNALEVAEAVKTLQGHGPDDFHAHCVEVAAYMLKLAGQGEKWADIEANRADVDRVLKQGQGFDRFRQMIVAQGGDVGQVDDLSKLPQATLIEPITAEQSGYIQDVFADKVGIASLALGAGREKKGDPIDFAVGIEVHVSVGDHVNIGDTLMTLHANDAAALDNAKQILSTSLTMSDATVAPIPLFYGVVDGADV